MQPPRCPYWGNASALWASRGLHNNHTNHRCAYLLVSVWNINHNCSLKLVCRRTSALSVEKVIVCVLTLHTKKIYLYSTWGATAKQLGATLHYNAFWCTHGHIWFHCSTICRDVRLQLSALKAVSLHFWLFIWWMHFSWFNEILCWIQCNIK